MKNSIVRSVWMFVMLVIASIGSGCMKPYPKPEFKEIQPHESAFVIPLEGDTSKQDAFASEELLLSRKIAAKRIEISKRWVKTGRTFLGIGDYIGDWKPTIMVATVNRTPVTVELTADESTGTTKKNQALYAESNDSIGLSSGFTMTAMIQETDAHKFLYKFKGDSLETVLNSQVRNSVQSVYSEICSKYDLNELRSKKQEITNEVRKRVIPMYAEWGITVNPDMGLVGGFVYENKEIQNAIDKVFVNQQMKQGNEALLAAQAALNQKDMSANSNRVAMVLMERENEAKGILVVAKAMADAGPAYIQNKQLEVAQAAVAKWNGVTPSIFGGGNGMPLMLNMPAPASSTLVETAK